MITEIYVENGVGRDVLRGLNVFTSRHGVTACFQHDVHPEMQRRQFGDEWWIRDIAGRGMAILTQDCAILRNEGERSAVADSGAKVIALGKAEYSSWMKMRCLAIHWTPIEEALTADGACAVTVHLSKYVVERF